METSEPVWIKRAQGSSAQGTTDALDKAFTNLLSHHAISYQTFARACNDCGYEQWLHANHKARFGVDNKATANVVSGAVNRLRSSNHMGVLFQFLHATYDEVLDACSINATAPEALTLKNALASTPAAPAPGRYVRQGNSR